MNITNRPRTGRHTSPRAPSRAVPLEEDRFRELLMSASACFAAAERNVAADRAQTIKEIKALIGYHNIDLDDLLD